jgi:hypothetical protein
MIYVLEYLPKYSKDNNIILTVYDVNVTSIDNPDNNTGINDNNYFRNIISHVEGKISQSRYDRVCLNFNEKGIVNEDDCTKASSIKDIEKVKCEDSIQFNKNKNKNKKNKNSKKF